MSVAAVALGAASDAPDLRLAPHVVAVPALASMIRPALVLPERETRSLLHAAMRRDVSGGGCFSAGPAGIQVWSGPFTAQAGHTDRRCTWARWTGPMTLRSATT